MGPGRGNIDRACKLRVCFSFASKTWRVGRIRFVTSVGLVAACAAGFAGASQAAGGCPNEAQRTGPSVNLPDCRAYELVTPASKSSAVQDLDISGMQALAAVDGEKLALKTVVAFGSTPVTNGSLSVFSRMSSGWHITSVGPSDIGADPYSSQLIFSPTLAQVGFTVESREEPPLGETIQFGVPGGPASEPPIPYDTIATTPNTQSAESYLAAATPDFSHVFLDSTDHTLLSSTPTGTFAGAHDVYELVDGHQLRLVNVTSEGSLVGECGARLQGISEDGSRVIFQSPDPEAAALTNPNCKQPLRLYMRATETASGGAESQTIEISEPNEGVVEHTGLHPAYFECASADGSKVFFVTETELTKSDEEVPGKQLYEYDANAKAGDRLTRISNSASGPVSLGTVSHGNDSNVFISTDGSKVYFLTEGKRIYRYDGLSKELHVVAATEGNEGGGSAENRWNEVTPNGNFFVFVTSQVYGFPVMDPGKYDEVYRYDDETGSLTCVSCLPGGSPQTGGAALQPPGGTGILETEGSPTPKFTAVSEDGSYVFFESTQSLVPEAVNINGGGDVGGNHNSDVYEWHDGVVSLISSPTDQREQVLLGTSADGSNVFFLTHSQLVPQDVDTSADIYDARIDGGFPASAESAACLGDTCLSVPVAPNDPTPALTSFSGPGDLASSTTTVGSKGVKGCGRGRVRKRGRCVKRRRAKRAEKSARQDVKRDRGGSK
jgi:hypothetical protein